MGHHLSISLPKWTDHTFKLWENRIAWQTIA